MTPNLFAILTQGIASTPAAPGDAPDVVLEDPALDQES